MPSTLSERKLNITLAVEGEVFKLTINTKVELDTWFYPLIPMSILEIDTLIQTHINGFLQAQINERKRQKHG